MNDLFKMPLKLKQADREYQANYNLELDNGVIIEKTKQSQKVDQKEGKKQKEKVKKMLAEADEECKNDVMDDATNPLFRTEFKIDKKSVRMVNRLGYEEKYTINCLKNNEHNYCTTTYYLL